MQLIARIPILFIFLLLFVSCGDPACELLDEAERIVDQSPAEASVLLKKVDPALIGDEDDRALYGLLSVQIRIERELPVSSDSVISASAAYYNGKWPSKRQIKALYYQGVVLEETGQPSKAFVPFMRARNLAKEMGDEQWVGKLTEAIDHIFDSVSSREEAIALGQTATVALGDYISSKQDVEIGRRNFLKIVILALFILFCALIIVSGVLIRFHIRSKNAEIRNKILDLYVVSSRLEYECGRNATLDNNVKENEAQIASLKDAIDSRERQIRQLEKRNDLSDSKLAVRQLFRDRWSELNIMCNEYFELESSSNARLSVVKNIERELEKMRSPKNIMMIVDSVNRYMDGIIDRLRTECHFLKNDDITFLALLYAGFSPRAVCLFTGIKLKYYYNKRSRIIGRIRNALGSEAGKFVDQII